MSKENDILFNKHNYLDKTKNCLIGIPIRVYDMNSGGYTVLKKNNVFTKNEINYLDSVSKFERNYYIGNKIRKENLTKVLMNGFIEARKKFMYYNDIRDEDILSIKKDAFFLINKPVKNLNFDGYSWKVEANYSSYYYMNEMEFYFSNMKNSIDVKGINEKNLEKHKDFILDDFCQIFKLVEGNNTSYRNNFIKNYRKLYLNRELDLGCYRELNIDSCFKFINGYYYMEDYDDINTIDIRYNYINYIIPLIGMIL